MTRLRVEVDEKLVNEVQQRLGQFHRKAPNAIANALNRAATNIKSNTSKEVTKEYVIKARNVKDTIKMTRAKKGDLRAEVRSTGGPIPLDRFKVSPKTVKPTRKKPIKVGVKKGGTKELMGAFVADIRGIKVFRRKGKARLPIERLFGPSVPQMLGNEGVREEIEQQGYETFQKRLDHEINRIIEKGRARQQ